MFLTDIYFIYDEVDDDHNDNNNDHDHNDNDNDDDYNDGVQVNSMFLTDIYSSQLGGLPKPEQTLEVWNIVI